MAFMVFSLVMVWIGGFMLGVSVGIRLTAEPSKSFGFLKRIRYWWNPPCLKHPGHRQREVDCELASGCAMIGVGFMCSECWEEYENPKKP